MSCTVQQFEKETGLSLICYFNIDVAGRITVPGSWRTQGTVCFYEALDADGCYCALACKPHFLDVPATAEHKIDPKGRVSLPAKIRKQFNSGACGVVKDDYIVLRLYRPEPKSAGQ
jgi:bifunctional DNA-binding transcriptional regulator/antitoxin component of YhaV-PrlF toxin-antitoxin module